MTFWKRQNYGNNKKIRGCQGRLADLVRRACDSGSQRREFKPRVGCRAYLNKNKTQKKKISGLQRLTGGCGMNKQSTEDI